MQGSLKATRIVKFWPRFKTTGYPASHMDPGEMLGVGGLLCLKNKTNLVAIYITLKYMIGMTGHIPHTIWLSVATVNENRYLRY